MMYSNKFVTAVKVNGKILRENRGKVYLPFGSEYSFLFKNLENRRAQVRFEIDGSKTSDQWFVIEPNSFVEVERFIKNGNLNAGNKFKFIERTSAVEQHRGVKAEDGLVRIEYKFEQEQPKWQYYNCNYVDTPNTPVYNPEFWEYSGPIVTMNSCTSGNILRSSGMRSSLGAAQFIAHKAQQTQSDAGITVPGSRSNQKFTQAAWFATESQTHVMILQLFGGTKPAITVDQKIKCPTCGQRNKAHNKFCGQCGTAVQII